MSDEKQDQPPFTPPVSSFTGPVGELIAQRMLAPPPRPGLLAVVDHFEIVRVLGGGGMGIVLLARDLASNREAAIKMVKSDLVTNQHAVHRFLKETGHLKRLRHTNIVPVEEISDRAEGPYFVMPYFEKGSLAGRIKPGRPLDTESILDIAIQVAEGLSFAHRSGIIHRDLKPANILLGAGGKVCLADFGLARTVFNDTIVDVESRQLEGTAPYVSPAIAAGDAEDTRCDIYSFGALLYEMLTGLPPYQGRGTKEILDQILAGPPKPILSVNPAADRALVTVAEGCMARELRDRYADMRDVLKDLRRIEHHETPVGPRAGGQTRSHHPATVLVAACVVIFAVAAFAAWMLLHKQPRLGPAPVRTNAVAPANPTNTVAVVTPNPAPAETNPPPATNATPSPATNTTSPVTVPPPTNRATPQIVPVQLVVNDIAQLAAHGIGEAVISNYARQNPPVSPLTPAELEYLQTNGVSPSIMTMMMNASQNQPAVVTTNQPAPAPPKADAQSILNTAYEQYALHRNREAIELCDQVLKLNPEDPNAWCIKGIAEDALRNRAEAIISFSTFLKLGAAKTPQYAAWHSYAATRLKALRGW